MELKLNFVPLHMIGYMMLDIPQEIFEDLKTQSFRLLRNNFVNGVENNNNLYGAIEKEYHLPDPSSLQKLLNVVIPYYFNFFYTSPKKFKLNNSWINYQKKYEHNPFHNHTNDLSFVIWISIPYNLEKEQKISNVVNTNNFKKETTAFTFYHSCYSNEKYSGVNKHIIQVDKSFEGKMIIFDSTLPHSVYPFYTSDDYRISIAGNIDIDKSGN